MSDVQRLRLRGALTEDEAGELWYEIERLRALDAETAKAHNANLLEMAHMLDEIERLRAELEREKMRVVACGVVALANTPDSAEKARKMHDDYRSASCNAVARAVDEQMRLRAERDALRALTKKLWPEGLIGAAALQTAGDVRLCFDSPMYANSFVRRMQIAINASSKASSLDDAIDAARKA
jgi:hypothetical protein